MRMRFDVDSSAEESAALATRDELVARFAHWLDDRPERSMADPADVALALGWKWDHGDGDYGRWTRAEVDELLLGHLPRKLGAGPDVTASIPPTLAMFVTFLEEEGLFDPTGDPADAVAGRALAQTRTFLDAMDDPANFGMAKRLLSSVGLADDETLDQATLDAAMARFNELSFEERGEILGLDDEGPDAPYADDLPPLPLPDVPSSEDLAAMAADVPLLRKVDAFAEALGPEGVGLTERGNIGMADGRRLVAATGVGDRVEGVRSTADLPELFMVAEVAREAAAVEAVGKRLRPVAGWASEPAPLRWERVASAVIGAGAATLSFGSSAPDPEDLAELGDQMALHVLAMLWLSGDAIPAGVLADMIEEATTADEVAGVFGTPDPSHTRPTCEARVADLLANLGAAGIVAVDGDGRVTLTEAGPVLAADSLREVGFGVLLPDDVAPLDAPALLDTLLGRDDDPVTVGLAWASARTARGAADELVAALASAPEPSRAVIGFTVLRQLGPEVTDAVRGLLDGPLAGHAWLHLADAGVVDYDDVPSELVVRTGIDLFVATADAGTPVDVVEMVLGNIPGGEHTEFVDTLALSDHPRTGELLEMLGRHHPDTATGKHARKAAHRWRSSHGAPAGGG